MRESNKGIKILNHIVFKGTFTILAKYLLKNGNPPKQPKIILFITNDTISLDDRLVGSIDKN